MTHLPEITSTPAERLQALKDSKDLMSGAQPGGFGALFASGGSTPGHGNDAIDGFLRLADYITTGHDYLDTHPKGKRRPIIKEVTNVTVLAPPAVSDEDMKHFIHHVENGDFAEFIMNAGPGQHQHDDDGDDDMGENDPDGGSK